MTAARAAQPRRRGAIAILAALLLAAGCGGHDDVPDDRGPTVSVIGSTVRIRCFGGDCLTGIFQDDGVSIVAWRTIGSVTEQRTVHHTGVPITDVDVETGDGNDTFRMYDRSTLGTLRLSMGRGDDHVDFDDGAPFGTTRIDLGEGNDRLDSNASFPPQRFRIDAGPGDDSVRLHHVPYPYANEIVGGDGLDSLYAPANVRDHAQRISGFEDVEFFCLTVESCDDRD